MFIVAEGIDGTGKTTQLELLKEKLEKNYDVILTKQPGGCELGLKLREMLLYGKDHIDNYTEFALYMADKAQHVKSVIMPALQSGKIVLCDRYSDSTIAYQGYGRGLNLEKVKEINSFFTYNLEPDFTFYFDIDPKIGLERAKKITGDKEDRFEKLNFDFFEKVRQGYLDQQLFNKKSILINANNSIENIHEKIIVQMKIIGVNCE